MSEKNYIEENKRRRKAVEKENDFLKTEVQYRDRDGIDNTPPENRKTQIENKKSIEGDSANT